MRRHHKRHHNNTLQRPGMTFKELLLVALVAVLAGVVIYDTVNERSALGLIPTAAFANANPIILTFRTEALVEEQFLDLNFATAQYAGEQTGGTVTDPLSPPPVTNVDASNTRIGGEVALFWTLPAGVEHVNIYREEREGEEKLLVEQVEGERYIDTDAGNGQRYTYRVASVVIIVGADGAENVYESTEKPAGLVAVRDVIPPAAPTQVTVTTYAIDDASEESGDENTGLEITWEQPADADLRAIVVYRSELYGDRGAEVTRITVPADADTQAEKYTSYRDADLAVNNTYYYTVVAVDAAGNESSDVFQLTAPGNPNPFTPFSVQTNQTQ